MSTTAPTNLFQYYQGQGQALPSVAERAPMYQQYGLGNANTYTGDATQNGAFLAALMKGAPPSGTPPVTGPAGSPPPGTITSSSTGQRNEDSSTINDINKMLGSSATMYQNGNAVVPGANTNTSTPGAPTKPDEAGIRTTYNSSIAKIDQYLTDLEQRRQQEVAGINSAFDTQRTRTEGAQKNEAGATGSSILRLGGYLGESASGNGVLLNLAQQHRNEISDLESKRQSAIQAANNAASDKQFELARMRISEARAMEEEINKRNDTFFSQALQFEQNNREKDKAAQDKTQFTIDNLTPSLNETLNSIEDPQQRSQYLQYVANNFGVDPAFLESSITKFRDDKNKEVKSTILSLLKDHPDAGVSMSDINSGDIQSVVSKVTSSSSYKLAQAGVRADINKKLADAAKAQADLQTTSGTNNNLQAWANYMATNGDGKLPPNVPAQYFGVVAELAKNAADNLTPGTIIDKTTGFAKNMSATSQGRVTAGKAMLDLQDQMRGLLDKITTAPGAGTVFRAGKIVSLGGEDAQTFDAIASGMSQMYINMVSGLSYTDKQLEQISKAIPSMGEYNKYNKNKLDSLDSIIKSRINADLSAENATLKGVELRTGPQAEAENKKLVSDSFTQGQAQGYSPESIKQSLITMGIDPKLITDFLNKK